MSSSGTTTASDGAELYFEESGEGAPLLLLHGFTGVGADWAHVFQAANLRGYRRIVPDARGHGRSTNPGEFGFRRCARDVLGLMDQLGLARVAAIGMSLGAKTLLHVASAAPERIERLVLVSATPRFPPATRELFRAFAAAEHTPEEWGEMRAKHHGGDAAIAELWRLPLRFAEDPDDLLLMPDQLARIHAKTLIVAGDRDPLYPLELAEELQRGIAGSELAVVRGGGHCPIFAPDEREAFVARVEAFFARVTTPPLDSSSDPR